MEYTMTSRFRISTLRFFIEKEPLRYYLLSCIMFASFLWVIVGVATADMRKPIQGAGWHFPTGTQYSEWKTGNISFDENLFNQNVIDSFGWEAKDVDLIRDIIPPFYYVILKNPDVWGPRRINVTAYIKPTGPLWEKFIAATKKFKDSARIDEHGWIQNYTAGCPFPNPKTGHELIWNFKKRFGEDDRVLHAVTVITNRYGEVRHEISIGALMFFDGRLTDGDHYKYNPNEKRYSRIDFFTNADPDLKGILSVTAQFDDFEKEDTFWWYLPATRRIHNMRPIKRTDRFSGEQDLMWENLDTFNGNPADYNCKLIGQKEMLVVHNGYPKGEWIEGKHMTGPNDFYQLVRVYVNEMRPKDPYSPFSKIVHYLDPEAWIPYYSEWFDARGNPFMFSCFQYAQAKSGIFVPVVMNHVDLQIIHSTGYCAAKPLYNVGLTPEYFDIENLKKEYPPK